MKRQCSIVLVLALAIVPALSFAQTEPKTPETVEEKKDAPKDETKPAVTTDGEDKKEDPKADATKTDATKTDATTETKTEPKATVGPGGRTMRTDYPAKEEALKGQMETDGLKGNANAKEKSKVYDTRIQELERKIDDMKEGVFRSKSRIVLLRETLLGGRNAGSRSVIVHHSKINSSFSLKRALYRLDGTSLINELDNNGSLADKKKIQLYNGSIGPGTHKLIAILQYQGKSAMFKYFEGYDFELKTSCDFNVAQGQTTIVEVEIYEGGNVTTSIEKRPKIKCNVRTEELDPEAVIKAAKKEKTKK